MVTSVKYCDERSLDASYLSNRKLFPYLHSLINTREGLGEFDTVMEPSGLSRILPTPRVFISGFLIAFIKQLRCYTQLGRHHFGFITICKHTSQPIRARVIS